MITDISFKLDDFEFNFDQLRSLYNKESDQFKSEFFINNRVDWIKFQEHVRNNRDHYSTFIADFNSYEIFHSNVIQNLMTGKSFCNKKIISFYQNYMVAMNCSDDLHRTSLYIIVHALVNNPKRYWNEAEKKITYNEIDVYKRLLGLNGFGLLNRNKFGMDLLNLFIDHYGMVNLSNKDINDLKSDLTRDSAVA